MPIKRLALLLTAFCLLLTASVAWAQSSTATLSGTIEDENGAVIPGAKITVTHDATAQIRHATTNESGSFTIPLLPPGEYTVLVERQGFTRVQLTGIILNVGDQKAVSVQLKVGDIKSEVLVTADASLVRTDGSVGTVIDRTTVENIPLNGRSFQTLFELTPGVTFSNYASGSGQFNVNGQRSNTNYVTVDGVSANTGIISSNTPGQSGTGRTIGYTDQGTTSSLVTVDALQEFRIQTSTFAPEFGRSPGGQISLITRSGENRFHGSLFESFRHDAMDAADWFVNAQRLEKPTLRQHQFGGTFSGPIFFPRFGDVTGNRLWRGKDKLFFFFSYEGLRLKLPKVTIISVPSLATRQAAHNLVKPFINMLPVPNGRDLGGGVAEFAGSYSDPSESDAAAIKLDYNITPNHRLFGRYSDTPSFSKGRISSLNSIRVSNQINRSFTAGLTSILGESIANDFRINYTQNKAPNQFEIDTFGGAALPPSDPFGTGSSFANTFYTLGFVGGASFGASWGTTGDLEQRQLNVVESVSFSAKDHSIKLGVDFLRSNPQYRGHEGLRREGIVFTNNDTALPRANRFVFTVAPQKSQAVAYDSLSLFAQDTWRVTPRLTITYGLRWEYVPPPHVTDGDDPVTLANMDNPYGGQVHLNPQGAPLWRTRHANLAPRVGASYMLSQKAGQEMVIRGGFGMFYDLGFGGVSGVYFQYPLTASRTCPGGVGCPAGTSVPLPLPSSVTSTPDFGARPTSLMAVDPELELPLVYQWNIATERSFGPHQKVTISYVGSEGRRMLKSENLRGINLREWPAPQPAPIITFMRNLGYSDYRALQLQYQRRLHQNFQAIVSHTFARSRDTASDDTEGFTPQLRLATDLDYGYSGFDVRHVLAGTLTYEVPKIGGHWLLKAIADGWGIDTIFRARSASPVNIVSSVNFNDPSFPVTQTFNVRPNVVPGQPFWIDDPSAPGGRRLNRLAFSVPLVNTQGDLPRGIIRGFPVRQVDVSLRREFLFSERLRLQFRAEVFNITNTPNFNFSGSLVSVATNQNPLTFGAANQMANQGPVGSSLSPLYSPGGPRSVQLSAKILF